MSVAPTNNAHAEEVNQIEAQRHAAVEEGESSSDDAWLSPFTERRPSFMSGIASLLDLSGIIVTNEVSTKHVVIAPPEQAIANAWMLVGRSLREVLPPDGSPVMTSERVSAGERE